MPSELFVITGADTWTLADGSINPTGYWVGRGGRGAGPDRARVYCRVIAILSRSSSLMRWSTSSAAWAMSSWTHSTVPVKRLPSGV